MLKWTDGEEDRWREGEREMENIENRTVERMSRDKGSEQNERKNVRIPFRALSVTPRPTSVCACV